MKDLITNQLFTLELNPLVMSTSVLVRRFVVFVLLLTFYRIKRKVTVLTENCACDVYDVSITCSKAAS